jgi:hypothetical protein
VESALDKVIRLYLTGGITRSYVRRGPRGQVEQVRQYASRARKVAWGSLKAGQVVQIAGVQYKVVQARVPQTPFKPKQPGPNTKGTTKGKNTGSGVKTGSAGQGVHTGGPASTGQTGKGVNTGAVTGSTIAQSVTGGKLPFGTPTVTNEIQNIRTQQRFFVYLPAGQQVFLIG